MDSKTILQLTREELKDLMADAIQDAFIKLGIDVTDPIEMQKDFQHMRDFRIAASTLWNKGVFAILVTLIMGLLGVAGLGIRQLLSSG